MTKPHQKAFSLIELLVVMGIIGILAALLFPAIAKAPSRAKQQACSSNLRQLGVAFHTFAHDHGDRFPQALPASEGGASDFNAQSPAFSAVYLVNPRVFRALSNELGSPRVLKCPSGPQRQAASFPQLSFSNISYFAHLHAVFLHSDSLLAGDNNLLIVRSTNGPISVRPGVVPAYEWSTDRHEGRGNALMGDGSVHLKKNLPATVRWPIQPTPIPRPGSPTPRSELIRETASSSMDKAGAITPGAGSRSLGDLAGGVTKSGSTVLGAELSIPPQARLISTNSVLGATDGPSSADTLSQSNSGVPTSSDALSQSSLWWLWLLLAFLAMAMVWLRIRSVRARHRSGSVSELSHP